MHGPTVALVLIALAASGATATQAPENSASPVRYDGKPLVVPIQASKLNEADTLAQTRRTAPEYPPVARARRQSGCVHVLFDVDPEGRPVNLSIQSSVPPGIFDESALRAARNWRFRATKNGRPAWAYNVGQPIRFFMSASDTKQHERIEWLCENPPPTVLVRPEIAHLRGMKVIAAYGGEVVAYWMGTNREPQSGSASVRFCVKGRGKVANAQVLASSPDNRYDRAVIAVLQAASRSSSFNPYESTMGPKIGWFSNPRSTWSSLLCQLTWSITFVTATPSQRAPVVSTDPHSPMDIIFIPSRSGVSTDTSSPGPATTASPPRQPTTLAICIDPQGSVTSASLAESGGDATFDTLALHILMDFRFFPQHDDAGRPIASCGWHINVEFNEIPMRENKS